MMSFTPETTSHIAYPPKASQSQQQQQQVQQPGKNTMSVTNTEPTSKQDGAAMRLRGGCPGNFCGLPILPCRCDICIIPASNNVTSLYGTWSSGSGGVTTGIEFANPLAYSFTYPSTAGIAYSFDDLGHFEEAQYRFNSNASLPHCIQTVVIWQHGTYTLNTNGSLTLTPFAGDGRIQVQDPCAAVTNLITVYEQETFYSHWDIIIDTVPNNYMLELAKFDGSSMPGLYLQARPPNMLPTVQLTDYGTTTTTSALGSKATKRSFVPKWMAK